MSGRPLAQDPQAQAARNPDKPAVVAGDRTLTYRELDARAQQLAAALAGAGVERGDRVVLVLPNGVDAAVGIYGAMRAGAAFSPLNPTVKGERLAYVLRDCAAAAVICDDERAEIARGAAAEAGCPRVIVGLDDLSPSPPVAPPPLDVDLAAVIYTSGSTGEPKGVTLSHRNMAFAADSIIEYLGMDGEDRVLCVLPLSFDYGLYQLLMCVRVGATLVLEEGFAFPGRLVQLLEAEHITGLPGVPTVFAVLTSLRGLAERELPHLRFLTNTGAALPVELTRAIRATFPRARLFAMYGLTECKRVSYLPPELIDEKPDSVGVPIPGTEAWIEDESGRRLGAGEVGELIVRGSHVMQGYWSDPAATAERLRPGQWPWERELATGDLFRSDAEGHLFFVGRRDDLIKCRGEKIVPREVEQVLETFPGVRQAAVAAVEDQLLGQAVHGHVEGEGDLTEHDLKAHCAEHLEVQKVPQRVFVHEALPRTPNGKVDKQALRQLSPVERGPRPSPSSQR